MLNFATVDVSPLLLCIISCSFLTLDSLLSVCFVSCSSENQDNLLSLSTKMSKHQKELVDVPDTIKVQRILYSAFRHPLTGESRGLRPHFTHQHCLKLPSSLV